MLSPSIPTQGSDSNFFADSCARLLVVTTFLNLNGLIFMLFGVTQVVSAIILFCTLGVLFFSEKPRRPTLEVFLFLIFVVGYVFFGSLYILFFNDPGASFSYIFTTLAGALVTLSLCVYISGLKSHANYAGFIRFVRNAAIFSAVAILFSGVLYPLFQNPPPSFEYRSAGFFANPNEAGFMTVIALVLLRLSPTRSTMIQFALVVILSFCVLATFSRAAVATSGLVIGLSVVSGRHFLTALTLLLLLILAYIVTVIFQAELLSLLVSQDYLSSQQISRLESVVTTVLSGDSISDFGGRSFLWQFGYDKALYNFPYGSGLGSFKHLDGGIKSFAGHWLGVHNAFLLIWGEAGFLALCLFVLMLGSVALGAIKRNNFSTSLLPLAVFIIYCSFTHDVLWSRWLNVFTAIMLCYSDKARLFSSQLVFEKNEGKRTS